jgi:DNA-binding transcriptional LysR family regulator
MPGSVIHHVEALRGDLMAFSRGVRASVRLLANTSGLSEYLLKALAAFLGQHPHISVDVEERESGDIAHVILTGAADLGLAAEHALPASIERIPFSEDRLVLVTARADELASRRQVDFSEVVERDFVGLITSSALARPHHRTCRTARCAAAISGTFEQFRHDRRDGCRRPRRCRDAEGRGETLRARDEDQRRQDQESLGQPAACDLHPKLQVAAAAAEAARRPSAHGGAVTLTSPYRGLQP